MVSYFVSMGSEAQMKGLIEGFGSEPPDALRFVTPDIGDMPDRA